MAARSLIGTKKSTLKRLDDLILWEVEERYCRMSIALTAGDYVIGQVIAAATPGAQSEGLVPDPTSAIVCEKITVPAGQTWDIAALVRGPCLVNFDQIVRVAGTGADGLETDAELATRLEGLSDQAIRFVREPFHQGAQDEIAD